MGNIPARVWIKDALGRYVFVNSRLSSELGIEPEKWVGMRDEEPDEDPEEPPELEPPAWPPSGSGSSSFGSSRRVRPPQPMRSTKAAAEIEGRMYGSPR